MANALVRGSLISLGLVGALQAMAVTAAGTNFVVPGSQAAQEKSCVEPTDFMRRNHMEVIKHQRDETVHGGIRSTKHSLAGCIACHGAKGPSGQPVPINDDRQFCGACHDFAAVRLNCFECHAKVPTARSAPVANPKGVQPPGLGLTVPGVSQSPGHPQQAMR
jgi:hypothetical protein